MRNEEEKLNGLFDGELDPKEQADMEARVARDVALQAKLAEIKRADPLVRAAFDGPMTEAVPDRFLNAIDTGLTPIAIDPLPPTAQNDNEKRWWQIGSAIAASLALGLFLGTHWADDSERGVTSLALSKALYTAPSAQSVALSQGETVTPQLSFAKVGGGYCRRFSLAGKSGQKTGLACRQDGGWSIEALSPDNASLSAEDGYVAAGAADTSRIDAIIDTMRAGDPLDKAAEAESIAKGWK